MKSSCGAAPMSPALADRPHHDGAAADLLSGRGLLDGPGEVVGAEHDDLDRRVAASAGASGQVTNFRKLRTNAALTCWSSNCAVARAGATDSDAIASEQADLPDQAAAEGRAASRTIGHTAPAQGPGRVITQSAAGARREPPRTGFTPLRRRRFPPEVPGVGRRA